MEYPKKLKQQVRELFKKHAWNMGVSHYFLDILWVHENNDVGDQSVHAETKVDNKYLKATFTIYPVVVLEWKKGGEDYLDHLIAHECAHILTARMINMVQTPYKTEDEVREVWESLTESIGRMSLEIKG